MLGEKAAHNLKKMIESLIQEEQAPKELHKCPECGGQLHIRFEVYTRGKKKLLGVQAWCENCQLALASDFAEPIPSWAEDK
jgi:hypothetical protein